MHDKLDLAPVLFGVKKVSVLRDTVICQNCQKTDRQIMALLLDILINN